MTPINDDMHTDDEESTSSRDLQASPTSVWSHPVLAQQKRSKFVKQRNSSMETASLTCSDDSLDLSLSDDTDEETCQTDVLRQRNLHLSFPHSVGVPGSRDDSPDDPPLLMLDLDEQGKIHAPSKEKVKHDNRRRIISCMVLTLLGLGCCYLQTTAYSRYLPSGHEEWKRFLQHDAPRIRRSIKSSSHHRRFTVRLSGNRLDLLQRSIDTHSHCPLVQEIQVQWNSQMRPPRKLFHHESGKVNSIGKLSTDAVLLLEEDVLFSCDELQRAFNVWRDNRDRMVGFFPFLHHTQAEAPEGQYPTEYSLEPVQRGAGRYTLVSDRAAFVHKLYAESYVSGDEACQDVALSIHCTAISGKAPLVVAAHPEELRTPSSIEFLTNSNQHLADGSAAACVRNWIEGHDIQAMPFEVNTFIGQ